MYMDNQIVVTISNIKTLYHDNDKYLVIRSVPGEIIVI
jgi:hypothetical protein